MQSSQTGHRYEGCDGIHLDYRVQVAFFLARGIVIFGCWLPKRSPRRKYLHDR